MDPQQRLLLHCVSSLCLPKYTISHTSVFIGIAWMEYGEVMRTTTSVPASALDATSQALSVASGRICFTFDLTGPAMSIDTACSSSLVAVHLGVASVFQNECDSTVTGGVNLILTETTTAMFLRAGMLAPDGRCKTLDAAADGYVRAESCDTLLLSPTANVNSESVWLCGTAVNQDGRTSSLTAPNGPSQTRVIKSALANASTRPLEVRPLKCMELGRHLVTP